MIARHFDRGHFDGRFPSQRIVLFAQDPPRYQGVLFTSPAIEPRSEPPCDHPEGGWQRDFDGGVTYCCTFCGKELQESEPNRESWIPCRCGHDLHVHALPGYGGCLYGDECACPNFERPE